MLQNAVVSREDWLEARKALLAREKELTRQRDALSAARRELPWVKVEKTYVFETLEGPKSLGELFEGRSQMIVHHFMFGPGWKEGCIGCSFAADHAEGALVHLENHDVSYLRVSRAPLAELEAYRQRMGWCARWVSSHDSDFNYDFQVSFTPEQLARGEIDYNYAKSGIQSEDLGGLSVFYRNAEGEVFHTYSAFGRGDELLDTTYMFLDLTPEGRNETGPHYNLMDWVKRHDDYGTPAARALAGE
ncbi:DUF899 domain-containing protein [Fodinicurvata fenggangensis]|uniref:DUF899 domain-containing protein n=1 Tax=Fodinicurvata fenggangensis TaxID=1121830 RepID=UPI0005567980|nr:thioredoxin family protein [Fodinicurvata fenggangensis]